MLTRKEAVEFLQNSWKMNDIELQLKADREMFLNKLIKTIYERVPFQLLSVFKDLLSLQNKQKLMTYTTKDINKMCMSGLGGNCGLINAFTWNLLKVFGYSAHFCGTLATTTAVDVAHLTLIVKDLVNTGDIHLVDCGVGLPTFTAISLNFNEESPIFEESFLEYKYIKHGGKILRMHGKGDLVRRNDPPIEGLDFILGKWRRFYEFTLEDFEGKTLDRFGNYFDARGAPKNMPPRAARYPGGKAVIILGNNLFTEQEDKMLKKTELGSDDEVMKAYQDYFPSIDQNLVALAYSTWKIYWV